MATKNGVSFRQVLVPANKRSIKCPYAMNPKKITIHNTDNQMPAINEINYMNSNNNQTSYHVAVDEKEAIQGLPFNRNGWHSGDGLNGYGNRNTVAIEICRNYDRSRGTTNLNEPLKSQYSKAEQNAIKYVAQLCIDLGIVANNNNIKTHNNWNGKWCPSKILNEGRLQAVKNAIIAEYNRLKGNNVKPSTPSKPTPSKPNDALYGAKLIKNEDAYFLATTNIKIRSAPSTKATHTGTLRKGDSIHYYKVYEGNGYRWLQYVGNSGNKLYLPYRESGSGKEQWGTFHSSRPGSKSAPKKKTVAQMAKEVIDGKHGTGHANRRKSLGISQSEYNKVRAEVNRLSGAKSSSKPSLTIDQMANKIINDKNAPTGHEARRKWLGINNATYQKVRARVNQKLK